MPVPTSITDLSVTDASNSPQGGDQVGGNIDNYFRAIQGIIRRQFSSAESISASSELSVPVDGSYANVTGTATVTTFTNTFAGRTILLRFAAGVTLKHSSSLVMPGAADYVTQAGDILSFVCESSTVWRCTSIAAASLLKSQNLGDLDDVAEALTNLGLDKVDNTSDADKPISDATQTALDEITLAKGTNSQNPNTATDPVIVTNHANTPDSSYYWHIFTMFYQDVSGTANRAQIAIQYSGGNRVYARSYFSSDGWTAWVRCDVERLSIGAIRVRTDYGYVEIGPRNTSVCNFVTDRSNYAFDKPVTIEGHVAYHTGNLPNPTTNQVGSATGALTVGALGSYAMLADITSSGRNPGDLVGGGNLRYAAAGGTTASLAPSGSWRCMGVKTATSSGSTAVTLWLRYA